MAKEVRLIQEHGGCVASRSVRQAATVGHILPNFETQQNNVLRECIAVFRKFRGVWRDRFTLHQPITTALFRLVSHARLALCIQHMVSIRWRGFQQRLANRNKAHCSSSVAGRSPYERIHRHLRTGWSLIATKRREEVGRSATLHGGLSGFWRFAFGLLFEPVNCGVEHSEVLVWEPLDRLVGRLSGLDRAHYRFWRKFTGVDSGYYTSDFERVVCIASPDDG